MTFGSHLYGTNTPASDQDFKGVFVPTRRDLLLQQAPRVHSTSTRSPENEKNTAADTDVELFALHQYVKLLLEGQTVALDMLFSPPSAWINRTDIWRLDIVGRPSLFLSRKCTAFVGYVQMQAAKYGVKGSRVHAVRRAIEQLSFLDQSGKLSEHEEFVRPLAETEHIAIVDIPSHKDGPPLPHLEVCTRKFAFSLKVGYVVDCLTKILGEYGKRALAAEKNEGIDWKALSHAVRVIEEAKQLLRDHTIVFPLQNAVLLRSIKLGLYQYRAVAEMIEQGLADVEKERELSTLPDEPNREAAEDLVAAIYEAESK